MSKQRTKTRLIGSYMAGMGQCVLGIMMIAGFVVLAVIMRQMFAMPRVSALFLVLAALAGLLTARGVYNVRLSTHCQRIQGLVAGKSREKLSTISEITRQDLSHLVRELRLLVARGFFPGAYVDLYRRDFVVKNDGPPPPHTPGPTVLREVKKRSILSVYLLGFVWVLYALLFPLYLWFHFVIAGVVSVSVAVLAWLLLPTHIDIVEEPRKVEPPPKPETINTGDVQLDEVLTSAMEYMQKLTALGLAITSERIEGPVQELLHICRQLFDYIKKHPAKVGQIRQFMNYYLPTTIKLLENYDELSREQVKGDNIQSAMEKIEGTMDSVLSAFQKELDKLYQDKAMDISVDIEVMQSMMEQEGLTGDILRQEKQQ